MSGGFGAHKARLNGATIWAARGDIPSPWIQVDIDNTTNVSGLLTQGDGGESPAVPPSYDWITKLKVSTFFSSLTDDPEVFIKDKNGDVEVIT